MKKFLEAIVVMTMVIFSAAPSAAFAQGSCLKGFVPYNPAVFSNFTVGGQPAIDWLSQNMRADVASTSAPFADPTGVTLQVVFAKCDGSWFMQVTDQSGKVIDPDKLVQPNTITSEPEKSGMSAWGKFALLGGSLSLIVLAVFAVLYRRSQAAHKQFWAKRLGR